MADAPSDDPNVAPMRQEVRSTFSTFSVMIASGLGGVAIILGIVLGIVLAND